MSLLVVYSSRTGNTRKIAEAAQEVLPDDVVLVPVAEAPAPNGHDAVAVGYWVDRGRPDPKALKYMESLNGAKVAAFGTLGADPNSPHAEDVLKHTEELLQNNELLGQFLCQGKVDPAVVETMKRSGRHPMTPERMDNLREASKHPDNTDLKNARDFFRDVFEKISGGK